MIALPPESLCSKLRLTLSARNLKDCDVFSKSDPMCVVYMSSGLLRGDEYVECGRTETLLNCLNAEWSKTICVDYFFEQIQRIRFEVYDVDSPSNDLREHDFIGSVETTLADIVASPSCRRTFPLRGPEASYHDCGELTVVAEEAETHSKEVVMFAIRAKKVDKKHLFGKSDPFLQIYRLNDDGSSQLVHRTEVISRTLNPTWKPFEIPLQQLCASDKTRSIRFECFNFNNTTSGESRHLIGGCEVTLADVIGKNEITFPLINEKKRRKKGNDYLNSGQLIFVSVTTRRNYSFLEYIAGGTQLDFSVAIDMTASNGYANDPSSLHYIGGGLEPNEYYIAIHRVAHICQSYNTSKVFDAMGFGAKLPPQNFVNHCFPLNVGSGSFKVFGVDGLLEAYQRCLRSCVLYGPTCFAPIITEAIKEASSYRRDGSRYQILLIITDGCINDFDATVSAIIEASFLPMSIIIIGVGGEDFGNMEKLDCDNGFLSYQGRKAQRDIVQFVPLRKFLARQGLLAVPGPSSGSTFNGSLASAHLAKEVLAELPDQLTLYMKLNNIQPRPSTNPFPAPPPPPIPQQQQPSLPIGASIGAMSSNMQGWTMRGTAEQIGFVTPPLPPQTYGPITTPYPAIIPPAQQYPMEVPPPSMPVPSAPVSAMVLSPPTIPTNPPTIGFMPSSSGPISHSYPVPTPTPPPPYSAVFSERSTPFAYTHQGPPHHKTKTKSKTRTASNDGRTQPSAPPPPP